MMNPKLKRFIETTIPMIICQGVVVALIANLFGFNAALVPILIYSIVDVLMTKSQEIHPTHIKYNGKYYDTLTELMKERGVKK